METEETACQKEERERERERDSNDEIREKFNAKALITFRQLDKFHSPNLPPRHSDRPSVRRQPHAFSSSVKVQKKHKKSINNRRY